MSFITELKRRNVFRVGFAYAVAAWVLLQVFDVIGEILELPAWGGKLILAMLVIGFFIALIVAWAYELTPEGVKRESEIDRSQSVTTQTGRKLNALIMGLLVVAVAYLLFDKFWLQPRLQGEAVTTTAEIGAQPDAAEAPADARPSVAVLPFDNRSNREEDRFFTDGIHDDLLTTIAKIGSLKVISRTSVMEYRDTTKKIPQISAELGVDHVLEGGIQRAGDVVRVNVQLIDARTDEHLWAEIYDRELTANNLFAIQNEISRAVAEALEATLTPVEARQLDKRPTDSLAAYDAYLRGRQLMPLRTSESLDEALNEFQLAVGLDPDFALAWVGLAETRFLVYWYGSADATATLEAVEQATQRALELDPLLGEAYAAQARIHEWREDYDAVETAFKRALELAPNYATAWHWYFGFLAQFPERLGAAIAASEKARELDPRSSIIRLDAAEVYMDLGDLETARRLIREVIALDPDFVPAYGAMSELVGGEFADLAEAYRWGLEAVRRDPGNRTGWGNLVYPLAVVGAYDEALATLDLAEDRVPELAGGFVWIRGWVASAFGETETALSLVADFQPNPDLPAVNYGVGALYAIAGDYERARAVMFYGESDYADRSKWDRLLALFKDDACAAGWVLMQSGDESLGRAMLERSIDYLENELPRHIRRPARYPTALCHAALGHEQQTLDALERMLDVGGYWRWRYLRQWPPISALAQRPRFKELEARFESGMRQQREALLPLHARLAEVLP
jgi:FimV-like protein